MWAFHSNQNKTINLYVFIIIEKRCQMFVQYVFKQKSTKGNKVCHLPNKYVLHNVRTSNSLP